MRYRWLVIIPFAGLVLGVCACMVVVVAMVPVASAWRVQQVGASRSTTPEAELHVHERMPQNMRELAQKIMDIANREQGQYQPIEFVRIGEDEYLILIAGTQLDSRGGNNLESAGQEVTRQSSPYLRQLHALIQQHIPLGSTLHFAGHSLGGMVANTLATSADLLEHYHVQTVTTFASPVNACPNPDVTYRRYIVEGDLIPLFHWAAVWSRLKGPLEVLKSACEGGYAYLDQTMIDHSAGPDGMKNPHSSYQYSQELIEEPLSFQIDRYDSLGRFTAEASRR